MRWYRYVPHDRVRAYEALGWTLRGPVPGAHGVWSVLMRFDGEEPKEP